MIGCLVGPCLANGQAELLQSPLLLCIWQEFKVQAAPRSIMGNDIEGNLSAQAGHNSSDSSTSVLPTLGDHLELSRCQLV